MNNCILMAEIIQAPQLRHTPEGLELAEMIVQFPGLRSEDPPATIRVLGWGNLAKEIHQSYHQGDHVLLEGRLGMNTIDRPEGFKEKRAELTVQKIHALSAVSSPSSLERTQPTPVASSPRTTPSYESSLATESHGSAYSPKQEVEQQKPQSTTFEPSTYPVGGNEQDVDDIPF